MKKQQCLLFKVFTKTPLTPLINSSSSSSASYIARRCSPFCSAAATTTTNTSLFAAVNKLHVLKQKKLPLLIVPYDHKGDGSNNKKEINHLGYSVCDGTLGFISLFDDDDDDDDDINKKKKKEGEEEVYKVHLPEIADRRICGSSEGWLITVHENTEVQLLNPISRVLVHLPPLSSFPEVVVAKLVLEKENYRGGICYLVNDDISGFFEKNDPSTDQTFEGFDSHCLRESLFKKVVTSTTAANSTLPMVVMAIYGTSGRLAFCRPSGGNDDDDEQKRWINLQGNRGLYDDVTFYKGSFYAIGGRGDVVVVKGLDGPSPFLETIIEEGEKKFPYTNYLVESSSSSSSSSSTGGGGGGGDLLKVVRRIEDRYRNYRPYRTTGFRVLKLDFNGGGGPASLVEITNLGEDCALFIGYNHSFSFSASKIPGCRGNCIYFTDNHSEPFHNHPHGGHDMGVYNLEDGSIGRLNYETTSSSSQYLKMPPPIWYVPN